VLVAVTVGDAVKVAVCDGIRVSVGSSVSVGVSVTVVAVGNGVGVSVGGLGVGEEGGVPATSSCLIKVCEAELLIGIGGKFTSGRIGVK